jgi:hypothetical protein
MNALLYSPTGVVEYDASYDRVITPSPFQYTPEELEAAKAAGLVETNPTEPFEDEDTGSDYSTADWLSVRSTLDRMFGPGGGRFVWYTHTGEALDVEDMATPHVFYALRMVWNHSVPQILKVGDGPNYPDVRRWSEAYRKAAIDTLANELAQREDELLPDLRMELFEMVQKTLVILQLGL